MVRSFGWAWLAFFGSLALAAWAARRPGWPIVGAHVLGTGFPALLCASALVCVGRPVPRWLLPLGFAVGLARGVLYVEGVHVGADGLAVIFEPGFDFAGAAVLLGASREARRPAMRALGLMLSVFGVMEVSNVVMVARAASPAWYVALGTLATVSLALAQMLVVVEGAYHREARAERRRTRELGLLREIAQTASTAPDPRQLAEHAHAALREVLHLDAGGVWVLSPGSGSLDVLVSHGMEPGPPPDIARVDPQRPVAAQVLRGEAIVIDDVASDPRPLHPYARELGLRRQAYYPLRLGEERLGLLTAARRDGPPFDAADQELLAAAAEELSLALRHSLAVSRLEAERRRLRAVIDAAPVGVLIEDVDGRAAVTNASLAHHLGLAEGPGPGARVDRLWEEVLARAEDPEEARDVVARLRSDVLGLEAASPGGPSERAAEASLTLQAPERRELLLFSLPVRAAAGSEVLGRVLVTRDVSEERELAAELRQSRKMETLGTLASGIAHDFNNHLTAILGNASLLLDELGENPAARQSLLEMERAAEHCTELTRSLLAFARRAPVTRQRLRLRPLIEDVGAMMRPIVPATIELATDPGPDDLVVEADATQLRQVLINLVVNARDAIVREGRIELRASAVGEGAERVARIEVRDDGCGMDAATRDRMFEPFYTTKGAGAGTGLGLAVVYGALQAHGGVVDVESAPGQGTTVRVELPAVEPGAAEEPPRATSLDAHGDETILVADDELMIRRLVRISLERRGYRVIEAADGLEAVAQLEGKAARVDAALLDLTMPGLDGLAALARLRALRPGLPVVLMSGLLGAPGIERPPDVVLLPKPFTPESLAQALRRALG